MPARWPLRIVDDRHAIAARIVGEIDVVGRTDAAHDVAFGMTQRHRPGRRGRRRCLQRRPPARWRQRPAAPFPGQPPSALTSSSGVTGLSGVSGGVSIETFLMNTRPERENQSASFDIRSDAPEQPASAGPSTTTPAVAFDDRSASHDRPRFPPLTVTACPTITLRHDHGCAQGSGTEIRRLSLIPGIAISGLFLAAAATGPARRPANRSVRTPAPCNRSRCRAPRPARRHRRR